MQYFSALLSDELMQQGRINKIIYVLLTKQDKSWQKKQPKLVAQFLTCVFFSQLCS